MGCKLTALGQCFPSEVAGGILRVHIGDYIIEKPVPFIKEDYPLDNISYVNRNILAYMDNGQFVSVIRKDGTFTKYTKDMFVCGFAKIGEFTVCDDVQIMRRCAVVGSEDNLLYEVWIYLFAESGKLIFDPVNRPGYFVMNVDENVKFIRDLYSATYFYPIFRLIEGKYYKVEKAESHEPLYELIGEFVTPKNTKYLL